MTSRDREVRALLLRLVDRRGKEIAEPVYRIYRDAAGDYLAGIPNLFAHRAGASVFSQAEAHAFLVEYPKALEGCWARRDGT